MDYLDVLLDNLDEADFDVEATVDGELHACRLICEDGYIAIRGVIYNDAKGRFEDGDIIRTSALMGVSGNIVRTRNSTYEIMS